jgi:hypothetical protein
MWRAVLVLTLWVSCGWADDPVPLQRVVIPAEQIPGELRRVQLGTLVQMERVAFEDLLRQAERVRQARQTPPRWVEARYRATLTDAGLVGSAEWLIHNPTTVPGLLPLDPLQLALRRARWPDNRPALLGNLDPGQPALELWVDKPGPQALALEWSAAALPEPGGQRFDLRVPACPITTLELDVPADRTLELRTPVGSVPAPEKLSNGHALYRLPLSNTSQIEFFLRTTSEVPATLVRTRSTTLTYDLGAGVRPLLGELDVEVLRGPIHELTLQFDAGLQPLRIDGADVLGWEPTGANVRVRFRTPFAGGLLRVQALPDVQPGGRWTCPGVRLVGAIPGRETINVRLPAEWRPDDWQPGDFRLTRSQPAPEGGWRLELEAQPATRSAWQRPTLRGRAPGPEFTAQTALVWDLSAEQSQVTAEIKLTVLRGPVNSVALLIPPIWQVDPLDAATTDLLEGAPPQLPTDRSKPVPWSLPLRRALTTGGTATLSLTLRQPPPPFEGRGPAPTVSLPLPDVGVSGAARTGTLALRVGPAYETVVLSAAVVPAPPGITHLCQVQGPSVEGIVQVRPRPLRVLAEVDTVAQRDRAVVTLTVRPTAGTTQHLLLTSTTPGLGPLVWQPTDAGRPLLATPLSPGPALPYLLALGGHRFDALAVTALAPTNGTWWRLPLPQPLKQPLTLTTEVHLVSVPQLAAWTACVQPAPWRCCAEMLAPPRPGAVEVPLLTVAEAERTTGRVQVPAHRQVEVDHLRQRSDGWHYDAGPPRLRLFPLTAATVGVIAVVETQTVPVADYRTLHRVRWQLARWDEPTFRVRLLGGTRLLGAWVQGQRVEPRHNGDGAFIIPLPAGAVRGVELLLEELSTVPGQPTAQLVATDVAPLRARHWCWLPPGTVPQFGQATIAPPSADSWGELPTAAGQWWELPAEQAVQLAIDARWTFGAGGLLGLLVGMAALWYWRRARRRLVVLVLLPLLPASAQAPPIPLVYLLPNAAGNLEQGTVLAPPALLDQVRALAKAVEQPPVPIVPLRAYYEGKIEGESVEFLARFDVQSACDRTQPLTLALTGVQLREVLLDGAAGFPRPTPTGIQLDVSGAGSHQVQVRFSVPLAVTGTEREVRVGVPEIALSRLVLDVPTGSTEVRAVNWRGAQSVKPHGTVLRLEADLGRGNVLQAHWRGASGAVVVPVVRARTLAVWDVNATTAELRVAGRFQITQGRTDVLALDVPGGVELASVSVRPLDASTGNVPPTWLRGYRLAADPGSQRPRRLALDLAQPVSGPVQVMLRLFARGPLRGDTLLGGATAVGASENEAIVAVRGEELDVSVADVRGLRPVVGEAAWRELWVPAFGEAERRPSLAWTTDTGWPGVRINVQRPKPIGTATQTVNWQIGPRQATVQATAAWTGAARSVLAWEVPGDVTVTDVRGADLWHWTHTGGRLTAWLRQAQTNVELRLTGQVVRPNPPALGSFEVPTMRPVEVPTTTTLRLVPEEGWALTASTLHQLRPQTGGTGYELRYLTDQPDYQAGVVLRAPTTSAEYRAVTVAEITPTELLGRVTLEIRSRAQAPVAFRLEVPSADRSATLSGPPDARLTPTPGAGPAWWVELPPRSVERSELRLEWRQPFKTDPLTLTSPAVRIVTGSAKVLPALFIVSSPDVTVQPGVGVQPTSGRGTWQATGPEPRLTLLRSALAPAGTPITATARYEAVWLARERWLLRATFTLSRPSDAECANPLSAPLLWEQRSAEQLVQVWEQIGSPTRLAVPTAQLRSGTVSVPLTATAWTYVVPAGYATSLPLSDPPTPDAHDPFAGVFVGPQMVMRAEGQVILPWAPVAPAWPWLLGLLLAIVSLGGLVVAWRWCWHRVQIFQRGASTTANPIRMRNRP